MAERSANDAVAGQAVSDRTESDRARQTAGNGDHDTVTRTAESDRRLAWRAEFARRWASAVVSTTHVPLTFDAIEVALRETLDGLLAALVADPFPDDAVLELGSRLVEHHLIAQAALQRILKQFGDEVLHSPEFADVPELPSRLVQVVCVFASGYASAFRDQTYQQQEHIRKALVQANDEARRTLMVSEARFRELFNSSATGIAISDLDGVVRESNPALREILGYDDDEFTGVRIADLVHPSERDALLSASEDVVTGKRRRFRYKARLIHSDGGTVWARVAGTVLRDADGGPGYQVTMIEDNTDLQLTQQELNNQALHDNLTGLPNRQFFVSRLEAVLAQARDTSTIALCHLALDGLTAVNAGLGHAVGDRLLQIVAQRLESIMARTTGMVARLSGGEFMVYVLEDDRRPDVVGLVEQIRDGVSDPVYLEGHAVTTTASIAVVERPAQGLNARELLRDAGLALHRVKATARGQWDLFDSDRDTDTRARLQLAANIPGALADGEFRLRYQPRVRLSDKAIIGVTPVVEWHRPGAGPVPSAELIDLAQQNGFIGRLGRWLLTESCQQAAQWHLESGTDLPPLVLRLTGQQSQDPDLVSAIWDALESTGLPASGLQIGLWAPSVLDERGDSVDNAETLAAMGVEVIVHDLDSVRCNLRDLGRLPLTMIELSERLIGCASTWDEPNTVGQRVIRGLVEIAGCHDMTVGAAGVEHADQAAWLLDAGVDVGQGNAFAPPMPPDEFLERFG